MLRLGVGWLEGIITQQTQTRTCHLYDFRVFLDSNASPRSVKLPMAKYSVDVDSTEGSWTLLMRCEAATGADEEESEEEGKEKEEKAGGGGGSGVPRNEGEESGEDGGGCGGGTGVPGADSEEEQRGGGGEMGRTNRNETKGGGRERKGGVGSASVTCAYTTSSCIFGVQHTVQGKNSTVRTIGEDRENKKGRKLLFGRKK